MLQYLGLRHIVDPTEVRGYPECDPSNSTYSNRSNTGGDSTLILHFNSRASSLAAVGLGLLMTAFAPAARSATISITTSIASGTLGDASNSFLFTGASVPSFGSVPVALSGTSLATSFGEFIDAVPGSASNSSVIDILVKPNVNGSLGSLDFKGTLSKVGAAYLLNFSGTAGATSFTAGGVNYTGLVFDGYDFALATVQAVNGGGNGKTTWLQGYVTTATTATPEPASIAITGLGFIFCGLFMRRRMQLLNVR